MSTTSTKEIVHQGWLTKSPPTKAIFIRPRWRRRWFVLKGGSYPNQFVLEYFTDEGCRRSKGLINLDECEQVSGPLNVQDRHRYTFNLRTPSRVYYLAADTETEMNKWVKGICQVCGLKIIEDESDAIVYARPRNENAKPPETSELTEDNKESTENSPTPSNRSPSGPYIPISECFTGKPIIFNPNSNEYYNTSSFPFPPKVNWETYPQSKDTNNAETKTSQTPRHLDNGYVPPRPPKKNSSKPTTPTTTGQCKGNISPRCPEEPLNNAGPSGGIYENVDENPDSSSTSSSLHSPPGSAGGGLYCNLPETTESKTAGPSSNPNPQPKPTSPTPSTTEGNSISAIPPKVDRNLKPEVKKANEVNVKGQQFSAALNSQSRLGCMTLPTKSNSTSYFPGPEIDRTRKPSDNHLTLSCTPAQLKLQSSAQKESRLTSGLHTSTLPGRRRNGPLISPHDKKFPIYHEYETTPGLSGTYMQIDTKAIKANESRSQTSKLPLNKKSGASGSIIGPSEGSVEYRIIDHVKTKALNQMRIEREEQLQTNTTRH